MHGQVSVRRPDESDADRLGEINVVAWQRSYAGIVPAIYLASLDVASAQRRWRDNLTRPRRGVSYLVAEVDRVVSSYVILGNYRTQQDADPGEDTAGWGEVYAIYTHPDLQGHGAGVTVHDAGVAALRDEGYRRAGLWVLAANDASLTWYAARGWRPDGAQSRLQLAGEQLDEVRLVRDLTAEGMA